LSFGDLTIAQGTGSNASHTIVQYTSTSENLAIIQDTSVSNITYLDFSGMSTSSQTLTGGSGDDYLIGASGDDTISGHGGNDIILGHGGDDIVTIGGNNGTSFTTTADGGSGTNTLEIDYAEVTKLSDFVVRSFINAGSRTTDGSFVLEDANGGRIEFSNFGYDFFNARHSFSVGGVSYYFNPIGGTFGDHLSNSHANGPGLTPSENTGSQN